MGHSPQDLPGALLEAHPSEAKISINDEGASITNGNMRAEISAEGHIRFVRSETGSVLLEEAKPEFFLPPQRHYRALSSELFHITVRFRAQTGERFYGMGQYPNGQLDQKGCVLDLIQVNNQVSIPFLISNRGYGFIWHNPAVGRAELANSGTRWVAEAARQIDYLVIAADSHPELMTRYADLTGYPPPDF
jgi:alpha-D-xyloside xylohydrolase